jgi:hypothetical protein
MLAGHFGYAEASREVRPASRIRKVAKRRVLLASFQQQAQSGPPGSGETKAFVRAHRWRGTIESGQAKSITGLAEQEGVTDALCLPAPTANLSCAVHQRSGWSYSRDNAGGGPQFEGRPCHRNPITSLIQDWIGGAPLSAPLGLFHRLIGTVTSRHRPTIKPSSTAGSIEAGRHGEHRDLVVTRRRITREQLWDHDQLRTIRRAAHREVGGPG